MRDDDRLRSAGQLSLRAEARVHQRAGYRYPGRYPVLRGVPLTFAANIREIWPDGTVSISRPYVRLDRQPEETKWAYVEEYNIPFHELGLEAGGDVIGVESARNQGLPGAIFR